MPNYHINDGAGGGSHTVVQTSDGSSNFGAMPSAVGPGGAVWPGVLDNSWTPDGRMLFVDGARENVWLYDPCKQTVTQVAGLQAGRAARPSMGIPGDGTGPHVFWSYANSSTSWSIMSKDISNPNNTAQTFLGPLSGQEPHPHVSDDAKVVAHSALDANGHAQVYVTKRDKSVGPVAVTTSGSSLTHSDHPHIAGPNAAGNYVVAHRQYDPTSVVETDPTTYKENQIAVEWVEPVHLANVAFQGLVDVAAGQHKMVTNPSLHPDLSVVMHDVADKGDVTGTPFGGAKDVKLADGSVTTVATLTTDPTKVTQHLASKGARRVK